MNMFMMITESSTHKSELDRFNWVIYNKYCFILRIFGIWLHIFMIKTESSIHRSEADLVTSNIYF